jgi:DNA-binding transcriptional MerR regulator
MSDTGAVVFIGSNEEVAQRLGITPAGLRRLADIYGEVYEPLQRDTHYNNRRLWTLEAVERLEAARELVKADRTRSIKAALQMLQSGVETSQEGLVLPSKEVSKDPLLLAVLEHVQRLEVRIESMQRQLEAPRPQTDEAEELRRMNAYLLGELERRRLGDEAKKEQRAWWRFWQRS